jgi:uncharacterized protein (DUF427 family)
MSRIVIVPHAGRVKVLWREHVVADTVNALDLFEGSAAPVIYIPRADAVFTFYVKTARSTHCPYKGDASYFTLADDRASAANAVWSYETPLPGVEPIRNHLAFYLDKVRLEALPV